MEKSNPNKAIVKRPAAMPFINFGRSFMERLKLAKISMNTNMGSLSKRPRNLFYYHAGLGAGNFKANRRKELARSRRRNMKPGAR